MCKDEFHVSKLCVAILMHFQHAREHLFFEGYDGLPLVQEQAVRAVAMQGRTAWLDGN